MNDTVRLDVSLCLKGYFTSRQKAREAIIAGFIYVDGKPSMKPSRQVSPDADINISDKLVRHVSRGYSKLDHALNAFKIDTYDKLCLDVGASTGGFTECLLDHGAKHVLAVDVGHGQLASSLRVHPRVTSLERTDIRILSATDMAYLPTLAVTDVSFISLSKILPALYGLITGDAHVVCLVKPQFEAGKEAVGKGGIIRQSAVLSRVTDEFRTYAAASGFIVHDIIESPIKGADGNTEFLAHLTVMLEVGIN